MTVPGLDPRIVVEISTPELLRRDSSTSLPSFDPQIHFWSRPTSRISGLAKFDCVPTLRSFPTTNASPLRVRPVATCQLPRGPLPTAEHRSRCMKIGHG